jgi:hypothetical protein
MDTVTRNGAARHAVGCPPECVRLRRVSPTFGFADIQVCGIHLTGLRVEPQADGRLAITPPTRTDREGRTWPVFTLQAGVAEEVAVELARLWALSQ